MNWLVRKIVLFSLGAVVVGCGTTPTEIVVSVDFADGFPCQTPDIDGDGSPDDLIEIVAERAGDTQTVVDSISADSLPATVSIVDDSESGGTVRITARLLQADVPVMSTVTNGVFESEIRKGVYITFRPRDCTAWPCNEASVEAPAGSFQERAPIAPTCVNPPTPIPDLQPAPSITHYEVDETPLFNSNNACDSQSPDVLSFPSATNSFAGPVEVPASVSEGSGFNFFGKFYQNFWVSTNGFLVFGDTEPSSNFNAFTPNNFNSAYPSPAILPFWRSFRVSSLSDVCVNTAGRGVYITWKNVQINPGTSEDLVTFTVFLDNNSNIFFEYEDLTVSAGQQDAARGQGAAIGIANVPQAAQTCADDECATTGLCADGESACGYTDYRFGTTVGGQTKPPSDVGFIAASL